MKHILNHKHSKTTCEIELDGMLVTCSTMQKGEIIESENLDNDSLPDALACYFEQINERSGSSYDEWVVIPDQSFIGATMQDLLQQLKICGTHDIHEGVTLLTKALLAKDPECLEAVYYQYLTEVKAMAQYANKDYANIEAIESRLLEITHDLPSDTATTAAVKREARIVACRNRAVRIIDQCRLAEYPEAQGHLAFLQSAAPSDSMAAYARLAEQERTLHASLTAQPIADLNAAFYQALLDHDVVRAKVLTALGAKLDHLPIVARLVANLTRTIAAINATDPGPDILAHAKAIALLSIDVNTASDPWNFQGFKDGNINLVYDSKAHYTFRQASALIEEETRNAEIRAIHQAVTPKLTTKNDRLLCEYFVAKSSSPYRYMPLIGSQRSFDLTLAEARKQCREEEASDSSSILALADFARIPAFKRKARAFLTKEAFKTLKKGKKPEGDALVNEAIFAGVCDAIVALGDPKLATLLYEQFTFTADHRQHYELNQVCGTIAIGLVQLEYHGRREALKKFIKHFGQTHPDSAFVAKVGYALAILSRDAQAALTVLAKKDSAGDRSLAAATVADLHEKKALPALNRLLKKVGPGAQYEALSEARNRLKTQKGIPNPQDRMIRMFGTMTSTQIATSGETDHQFVLRAAQRAASTPDLPTETDAD